MANPSRGDIQPPSISPVDPSKNIILMASAGTGKTFNLALRVVACLMRGISPSTPLYDIEGREAGRLPISSKGQILAITFTRKATEEMRRRVVGYLGGLADGILKEDSPEVMELSQALRLTEPTELRARAAAARRAFFYNPKILKICTIDSFMTSILRLFPLETDIPKDFEIKRDPPRESAMEAVFTNIAERGRYLALFKHHIERERSNNQNYSSFNFFEELTEAILWVMTGGNYIYLEEPLEAAVHKDVSHVSLIFDELLRVDEEIIFIAGELVNALKDGKGCKELEKELPSLILLTARKKGVGALIGKFKRLAAIPLPDRFNSGERAYYRKLFKELESVLYRRTELTLDYDRELILNLTSKVYQEMDKIKRERREVTYEDITHGVYNLFVKGGYRDYLYFRLDGSLEHILADEFQDTSAVQWEILKPICEEAMAGLSQGGKSGSFFCVGDSKQSIYRFRGAMPAFMSRIEAHYRGKLISRELDINYRSDKSIVEFTNTLFADADARIDGGEELRFNFTRQKANSDKDGFVKLVKVTGANSEERATERLLELQKAVEELDKAGYARHDIAVLVTQKKHGFEAARYLNEHGYTASAAFPKKLTESAVFRAATAFAEYLRSKSPLSMTEFLCIPPACIDMKRLGNAGYMERMKYLLDRAISKLYEKSVYRKAVDLPGRFSFAARFSGSTAFTTLFDMLARELPFEENPLLFNEKLIDLASFSEGPDRAEGITVSTVHSAKGLEFPAVILFNVKEPFNRLRQKRFLSRKDISVMYKKLKEEEEEYAPYAYRQAINEEKAFLRYERLNALYVAVTRAKHALYVFAEKGGKTTEDYILEHFPKGVVTGEISRFESSFKKEAVGHRGETGGAMARFLRRRLLPKIRGEEGDGGGALPYSIENRLDTYLEHVAERIESSAGYEPAHSRLYGLLFHEAVYMLDMNGVEEWDKHLGGRSAAKVWPRYAPYLQESDLTELKGDLAALVCDDRFRELLRGRKIFRERKFFHQGELLVVDLYALGERDINLLDFKTSPTDTDRLPEYQRQVEKYGSALSGAYGLSVNAFILFIKGGVVSLRQG